MNRNIKKFSITQRSKTSRKLERGAHDDAPGRAAGDASRHAFSTRASA